MQRMTCVELWFLLVVEQRLDKKPKSHSMKHVGAADNVAASLKNAFNFKLWLSVPGLESSP